MNFKVTIHYQNSYGFIEYDETNRKFVVELPDVDKKKLVEQYLSTEHVIRIAQDGLRNFAEKATDPAKSLENFKIALTRMWNSTGVIVDWSHPVVR